MTAADTRVGDADVSGRSEGGVQPPIIRGFPLFRGRRVATCLGIARGRPGGSVGTVLGGFRSPGRRIRGLSSSEGGFRSEGLAGEEDIAGVEDIVGAEDIAGAVTIALVGLDIWTIIV